MGKSNKNTELQEIRRLIRNGNYADNPQNLIKLFRKLLNYRLWREIYMTLIKRAIEGKTIYYSELAHEVNKMMEEEEPLLPEKGSQLASTSAVILDVISHYEHLCGRPLLSAIVIRKKYNTPGDGFWEMMKELYREKIENMIEELYDIIKNIIEEEDEEEIKEEIEEEIKRKLIEEEQRKVFSCWRGKSFTSK